MRVVILSCEYDSRGAGLQLNSVKEIFTAHVMKLNFRLRYLIGIRVALGKMSISTYNIPQDFFQTLQSTLSSDSWLLVQEL